MQYPLMSEYVSAIRDASDNLGELACLVPVQDDHGEPYRSSGAFAVVFKMKDEQTGKCYALKCFTSNPQPIGFSGILLAKRQNSFYCTYFLHNRNVADTKSPYPIKRLEVIRWFNQKSMVFNQSLS